MRKEFISGVEYFVPQSCGKRSTLEKMWKKISSVVHFENWPNEREREKERIIKKKVIYVCMYIVLKKVNTHETEEKTRSEIKKRFCFVLCFCFLSFLML